MITLNEVKTLMQNPVRPGSPVLSFYMSCPPEGGSWNQPLEAACKSLIHELERTVPAASLGELWRDAKLVMDYTASHKGVPQSIVAFADASEGLFWARDFHAPLRNLAVWKPRPYVLPLLETLDEYERYAVALVEKSRTRLFIVSLGQVEEALEITESVRMGRISTTGRDNLRSQTNLARSAERKVRRHLETTAEVLAERLAKRPFDRLFVGGPPEAVSVFLDILPPALRGKFFGRVTLDTRATAEEVLARTLPMERVTERGVESGRVRELIEASRRSHSCVLGLDAVLLHAGKSAVRTLFYAEGFAQEGSRCSGCGELYSHERQACGRCGALAEPVEDLLEALALAVVEGGGRIEQVRDEAAELLRREGGGVGVVLKEEQAAVRHTA